MAIAQTQIQNSLNANPLQSLMQGTEVITSILNNAAAAARQRVDNQRSQDSALMQNLQLAQGLAQRRGQDLDQRLIDRRNFNYRQDQDAIANDLRYAQFDANQDERLFNRGLNEQRLDISRSAADRQQAALDLRQAELQRQRDALNAMGQVPPLGEPTAANTPMPPEITPQGTVVQAPSVSNMLDPSQALNAGITAGMAPVASVNPQLSQAIGAGAYGSDRALNAAPQPANPYTNFSDAQLNARVDMYKNAEAANRKAGNSSQLNQNISARNEIEAEVERRKLANKTETPAQKRAEEDQQFQRDDRTTKQTLTEAETLINSNREAFPSQLSGMREAFSKSGATSGSLESWASQDPERLKRYDAAKAYEDNKVQAELNSARNMTQMEYISKGPKDQAATRKRIWELANSQVGAQNQSRNIDLNF